MVFDVILDSAPAEEKNTIHHLKEILREVDLVIYKYVFLSELTEWLIHLKETQLSNTTLLD